MDYLISHTIFGFCGWEILPIAAIILLAVAFSRKRQRLREEEEELRASIRSYEAALGKSGAGEQES